MRNSKHIPAPVPLRRCAVYVRKSTNMGMEQNYTSIDAQIDSCIQYVENHAADGWVLAQTASCGIYQDVAISGATMERPGVQALLADIRAKRVDVVVCYKLDRISRSIRDFANLMFELEEMGVSLVLVTQNFDSGTPMGRLCLHFLSSFAEFERCMIRDRIKDKAAARAAQGLWIGGRPPFGYRLGEQRMLVTEPAEAEVVRRIYEGVLAHTDLCELALRLNQENAPRPRLRKGVEDNAWSSTRIRQLVERPLYSGVIVLRENEYPGQHEALVSRKDWEAAQCALAELLAARKPRESHPELVYPLRGILVCPLCGLPMKPTYAKTRGQIHRYYECPNHINRDKGCPTRNLPAEAIEMAVASNLASLASNPAMMRVLQERLPQLAHRDISEALANVEQLVEYIPDDALATLFQALYKEVSYNAAAQELNIVKYSA